MINEGEQISVEQWFKDWNDSFKKMNNKEVNKNTGWYRIIDLENKEVNDSVLVEINFNTENTI